MKINETRYAHLPAAAMICLLAACLHLLPRRYATSNITLPAVAPAAITQSETRLALGLKIPLRQASVYDLELIPGISDVLANRLVKATWQIMVQSLYSQGAPPEAALALVHGIGEKKAATFGRHIELGR